MIPNLTKSTIGVDVDAADSLQYLEAELSSLGSIAAVLQRNKATLTAEIQKTDWVFFKDPAAPECAHARSERQRLYSELHVVEASLRENHSVMREARHRRQEHRTATEQADGIGGVLRALEQQIADASSRAKQLSERLLDADAVVNVCERRLVDADAAIALKQEHDGLLKSLRSKAFGLQTGKKLDALDRRIAAEVREASDIDERAMRGLAARQELVRDLEEGVQSASRASAQEGAERQHLENLRGTIDAMEACARIGQLVEKLREPVARLLKADPEMARRLFEAWRHEGLRVLDYRGWLQQPQWLETDGLTTVDQPTTALEGVVD